VRRVLTLLLQARSDEFDESALLRELEWPAQGDNG
jgi:hypothetical protein